MAGGLVFGYVYGILSETSGKQSISYTVGTISFSLWLGFLRLALPPLRISVITRKGTPQTRAAVCY